MFVQFVSYTDNEGLSNYDAWKDLHTNLLAADQYRDPIQRHSSTHTDSSIGPLADAETYLRNLIYRITVTCPLDDDSSRFRLVLSVCLPFHPITLLDIL